MLFSYVRALGLHLFLHSQVACSSLALLSPRSSGGTGKQDDTGGRCMLEILEAADVVRRVSMPENLVIRVADGII